MTQEKKTPKIYCFINSGPGPAGMVVSAVAEDGRTLWFGICQGIDDGKELSGIGNDNHKKVYSRHYPDGYELVWYDIWTELPDDFVEMMHLQATVGVDKMRKIGEEQDGNKGESAS